MNGPQHYALSEELLRGSYVPLGVRRPDEPAYGGRPSAQEVAVAQVHATLALAAATADAGMSWDGSIRNDVEWREVVK